ncbi:MAG: TRAP transporter fused permease subunit [Rhodospirillaceae bacterium]|nr:TRAP transporter fused permease subunit [Rhodospirillaceae bacterium]
MSNADDNTAVAETLRHRPLSEFWTVVVLVFTTVSIILSINQIYNLGFLVDHVILDNQFLYLLAASLLPLVFLIFPMRQAEVQKLPVHDIALFAASLAIGCYLAWHGDTSIEEGWEYDAPDHARYASYVLWALLIEAVRRAGGMALTVIVLVFAFYPPFAEQVPGPIQGFPVPMWNLGQYYAFSEEAILGIPMQALGLLVLGFIIFGIALQHTGAGRFFIDFAFALLGHVRGGAAKVSIFSSGLLGSMSGSVITNVLTTGALTIPAMKRTGFSPRYAAGVEACASTGGVLMPPVMGATAFVMASFLEVQYIEVAIAAVIPSLLFYLGLFLQIDAYAARSGLKGLPRDEMPKLGTVIKQGWHYIFAFGLLVFMLLELKREAQAPFYATAMLIASNQIFGQRWGWKQVIDFVYDIGKILAELVAILAAIGLIIGALVVTGLAGTIATDLIILAGGNVYVLLLMGAATSFILGMGMTVTAAYIFLAIVLAPSLISAGLDPMGVHLFILYWGMLSYITPPVALGAFAASTLSGSKPMAAGFAAMKLGSIIYFIPFFFVLNAALILRGELSDILIVLATSVPGVLLIAAATQGYLLGLGRLNDGPIGYLTKFLLFFGGLAFAFPGSEAVGINHIESAGIGAAMTTVAIVIHLATRPRSEQDVGVNP